MLFWLPFGLYNLFILMILFLTYFDDFSLLLYVDILVLFTVNHHVFDIAEDYNIV